MDAQETQGTKVCPQCSETIQAQALVCRFCGYDYRTGGRGPATAPSTNGLAIASMVLGILWIWWVGSILALVFGYMAKRQIAASGGSQSGGGLATAGIVLGWIGVATLIGFIVLFAVGSADMSMNGQ